MIDRVDELEYEGATGSTDADDPEPFDSEGIPDFPGSEDVDPSCVLIPIKLRETFTLLGVANAATQTFVLANAIDTWLFARVSLVFVVHARTNWNTTGEATVRVYRTIQDADSPDATFLGSSPILSSTTIERFTPAIPFMESKVISAPCGPQVRVVLDFVQGTSPPISGAQTLVTSLYLLGQQL